MNVLEKILKEIEERVNFRECLVKYEKRRGTITDACRNKGALEELDIIAEIIRSHMDEVEHDGWIPVEERLPEANERVLVTVKHSRWIADFDSNWVPEEKKIKHPETNGTYIGCINENGIWIFIDEEGQDNICDKEFGLDLGIVYDVVTHWQHLPESYKPKKAPAAEHIMSRFMTVE